MVVFLNCLFDHCFVLIINHTSTTNRCTIIRSLHINHFLQAMSRKQTLSERFSGLEPPDYSTFRRSDDDDTFSLQPSIVRPRPADNDIGIS